MAETTSLEEQALKRKERLKALKRKKDGDQEEVKENKEVTPLPKPRFRSYQPEHKDLSENILPAAQPANITAEIQDQLASAKTKVVIEELDISNLAPRKPDWDLKRDVSKKLEKLERRTQKAIAELIREKLKQRQEDLATIVTAGTVHDK